MKYLSIPGLLFAASIQCSANIDSIDFWHVKYNDSTVAELTEAQPMQIIENLIKPGDSLRVLYFKDTQCETCLTDLLIVDSNGRNFKIIDRYHPREWISLSLNELRIYAESVRSKYFRFYYWERPGRLQDNSLIEPASKKFIFSVLFK